MAYKIADNITSPIGLTTEENYQAVKQGCSSLSYYTNQWGIPEPFTASVFSNAQNQGMKQEGLTRFESLVVKSVRQALEGVSLDISNSKVVFILSTTKANIELLGTSPEALYPGKSARRICLTLGIKTKPIVAFAELNK